MHSEQSLSEHKDIDDSIFPNCVPQTLSTDHKICLTLSQNKAK